ncbi:MAG: HAD family phosphatase [Anaerolineae bacterium]|nr:HAD family phosphatase [Anaerolineae bacterium]
MSDEQERPQDLSGLADLTGLQHRFAVLWDMDGVLVDSGDLHRRAWRLFLARHGHPASDALFHQGFGRPNEEVLPVYWPDLSAAQVARLSAEKEACYRELVRAEGIAPIPGAIDWVARFHTAGVRQAMATSGCRENAALIVETLGIGPALDAVVAAGDVARGKPAPDVFLHAAACLGVPPARCLVIEDSVYGVRAARAGGMRCLALETTHPARELGQADLVLPDMRAFSWAAWRALLPSA